jgi:hypothetical protein
MTVSGKANEETRRRTAHIRRRWLTRIERLDGIGIGREGSP